MTKKTPTRKAPTKRASGKSTPKNIEMLDKKVIKKATKKVVKKTSDVKKVQELIKEKSISKNKRSQTIKSKMTISSSIDNDKGVVEENHINDPGFLTNQDVFDEADHAQWQQLREQALIHHMAKGLNKVETHPDFDGIHCIECDVEIPPQRIKLQKIRCVDCQQELEDSEKRNSSFKRYNDNESWGKT